MAPALARMLPATVVRHGLIGPTATKSHAFSVDGSGGLIGKNGVTALDNAVHLPCSARSVGPSRKSLGPETCDSETDDDAGSGSLSMEGRGKILFYRSKRSLKPKLRRLVLGDRRKTVSYSAGVNGSSNISPKATVAMSAAPITLSRGTKPGVSSTDSKVIDQRDVRKQQPYGVPDVPLPVHQKWDVVGLGQAMVDFSAMVSDDFIEQLNLPKGSRKVIDHEERGQVLRALDGCSYKVSAGGSLSNSLVALARLGTAVTGCSATPSAVNVKGWGLQEAVSPDCTCSEGVSAECDVLGKHALSEMQGHLEQVDPRQRSLNVAMTGSVGSDALGGFYRTKLLRANVHFLSEPISDGTTGTVMVLTTPDAQRTMLAYMGMSSHVTVDSTLEAAVSQSRMLVVEGYLWDIPQTVDAIERACQIARSNKTFVALTASDVFCVQQHWERFWDVLSNTADVLFTNTEEARALTRSSSCTSPADMARYLSHYCPLVSVTDGDKGAYLAARGGKAVYIPPSPCVPVDSCGAGDAYAAGVLYGLLAGVPSLRSIGHFASDVAAVVVGQQGARLKEQDAAALVKAHERAMQGCQPVRSLNLVQSAMAAELFE